ncbi:MAG TPA: NAD-dependent epimerase/dehydratase family protein [Gaiellaceae bacterium]|nr:NAD-dependent epimerase/dehydratase family protein [Gaiellaceae bacterium]
MRVLVTGGSGFIGSHVVDRLRAQGHVPVIFDLVESPYHAPGEIETVIGDLEDYESVRAGVAGCDMVAHLAAVSDVNIVVDNPAKASSINVGGTAAVLEAARSEGVRRVVYASTVWVYGGAEGVEPLDEDTQLAIPDHLYTATKLTGEMYCRSYAALYGLEYTVLRFGIPYGPHSRPATVLAAFVEKARGGHPLTLAGDGSQTRQFVYVEDLAAGVVAALAPEAANRTYNLVGDESVTIREIAEAVQELVAPVDIVYMDSRPSDLRPVAISGARAAAELGWSATTTFAEGVRRYVESVLAPTNGTSSSSTAASTSGSAPTVLRQEPSEL